MFKIRASPLDKNRCTLRVFSFECKAPITGSVIVRRSSSMRMVPVVKRTRPVSPRRADLNRGKPTVWPLRRPFFESDQLSRAFTRSAIPEL